MIGMILVFIALIIWVIAWFWAMMDWDRVGCMFAIWMVALIIGCIGIGMVLAQ